MTIGARIRDGRAGGGRAGAPGGISQADQMDRLSPLPARETYIFNGERTSTAGRRGEGPGGIFHVKGPARPSLMEFDSVDD